MEDKILIPITKSFIENVKKFTGDIPINNNIGNTLKTAWDGLYTVYIQKCNESKTLRTMYQQTCEKLIDMVNINKEHNSKIENLNNINSKLKDYINSLKDNNSKLQDEITNVKNNSKKLEEEITNVKNNIKKLQEDNKKLEDEVKDLKTSKMKYKRKYEDIKSKDKDDNIYINKLENIHKKIMKEVKSSISEDKDEDEDDGYNNSTPFSITKGKIYKDGKTSYQLILDYLKENPTIEYTIADISKCIPDIPRGSMHLRLNELFNNNLIAAEEKENGIGYYYSHKE